MTLTAGQWPERVRRGIECVIWASFLLFVAGLAYARLSKVLGYSAPPEVLVPCVTVVFFIFALAHATVRLGAVRALLLLMITAAVSLMAELAGTSTGLIFGAYHYSDSLGPKVAGLVPSVLPLAWFMMIYCSYSVASVLGSGLGAVSREGGVINRAAAILGLSALGALAMTAWDLSLDPVMVHFGFWSWHSTGEYFGVPASNYIGWLITAFAIYAAYLIATRLIATRGSTLQEQPAGGLLLSSLPVAAYWVQWVDGVVLPLQIGEPGVAVATFFGMGAFAVAAGVQAIEQVRVATTGRETR